MARVCAIISLSLAADSDGVDCDDNGQKRKNNTCICIHARIYRRIHTRAGERGTGRREGEGCRKREKEREKKERKRGHVTRHNTNETDGAGPWEALTAG